MKQTLLVSFILLCVRCIESQRWSECIVEGVSDTEWSFVGHSLSNPIDDTHEGVVTNFTTKNINSMTIKKLDNYKYLTATLENGILTISTTEAFKNFEKDRKGYRNLIISLLLDFECTGNSSESLTFNQKVTDVNNHDPNFSEDNYEFHFGTTIPEGFEFTELQSIFASDDDYTNSKITFSIDGKSDSLELKYKRTIQQKYFASLKALSTLTAPFREELTIIATDDGKPVKSTRSKVVVSVISPSETCSINNGEQMHPPEFSQLAYIANYTEQEIKLEEDITIKYGLTTTTTIEQSDYKEYFKIAQSASKKELLEVTLLKKLPKEILQKDFIIIEIKAFNKGISIPGKTILVINFSENIVESDGGESNSVHPPVFTKHVYNATYSTVDKVHMEEEISFRYGLTNTTSITQSGYEDYFKILLNEQKVTIQLLKDLPKEMFENQVITIEIEAVNYGLNITGRTVLIVELVKGHGDINNNIHPPVFSKHVYQANYTFDDQLKMNEDVSIIHGGTETTSIKQSDYKEYFKIIYNNNNNKVEIQVIKTLPKELLEMQTIIIELEASNQGLSIPGSTILVIHLKIAHADMNNVHPPVFSDHVYHATYTIDHELKMDKEIKIKYGLTDTTVVNQSGYEEYFKINNQIGCDKIEIMTVEKLPKELLEKQSIVIEMEAVNEGLTIPGRAVLVIQLMKNSISSEDCDVIHVWGLSFSNSVLPFILFLSAILSIVFLNILVLSLYYRRQRTSNIGNQTTVIGRQQDNFYL